jgi:flavin-dependent dehydrogenase
MIGLVDVCVAGGGPAGSATALGLARLGYRIALFHTEGWGPARLEYLPSSVWALLETLDLRTRVEAARFIPCSVRHVRWSLPREEQRHDLSGLLVHRSRLDAVLLDAVRDAGVRVVSSRTVPRLERHGAGWRLNSVESRVLVDAAGRRGVLPRRRRRLSASMVALSGRWREPSGVAPRMAVEGLTDGWCWAATEGTGIWEVSVFLDTTACAGLGYAGRAATYYSAVAESAFLAGFQPIDEPVGICDASAWLAEDVTMPRAIRVGDAALARDPLSSQGVVAALRAAPAATEAASAILSGADADAVRNRYESSYRSSAIHHTTTVAAFYAAGAWRTSPFWQRRSSAPLYAETAASCCFTAGAPCFS